MGLGTAEIDKCANGFNRESAMLKLPKRGGNGASLLFLPSHLP